MKDANQGRLGASGISDHLSYLMPVYGGSSTPIGKGLRNLSRHESMNRHSLAAAQLAGIKLLLLAIIWQGARALMDLYVYGAQPITFGNFNGLAMPRLSEALESQSSFNRIQTWGGSRLRGLCRSMEQSGTVLPDAGYRNLAVHDASHPKGWRRNHPVNLVNFVKSPAFGPFMPSSRYGTS